MRDVTSATAPDVGVITAPPGIVFLNTRPKSTKNILCSARRGFSSRFLETQSSNLYGPYCTLSLETSAAHHGLELRGRRSSKCLADYGDTSWSRVRMYQPALLFQSSWILITHLTPTRFSKVVSYWSITFVYRLFFHPYAKYPGPKIAAISELWYAYHWYVTESTMTSVYVCERT